MNRTNLPILHRLSLLYSGLLNDSRYSHYTDDVAPNMRGRLSESLFQLLETGGRTFDATLWNPPIGATILLVVIHRETRQYRIVGKQSELYNPKYIIEILRGYPTCLGTSAPVLQLTAIRQRGLRTLLGMSTYSVYRVQIVRCQTMIVPTSNDLTKNYLYIYAWHRLPSDKLDNLIEGQMPEYLIMYLQKHNSSRVCIYIYIYEFITHKYGTDRNEITSII